MMRAPSPRVPMREPVVNVAIITPAAAAAVSAGQVHRRRVVVLALLLHGAHMAQLRSLSTLPMLFWVMDQGGA